MRNNIFQSRWLCCVVQPSDHTCWLPPQSPLGKQWYNVHIYLGAHLPYERHSSGWPQGSLWGDASLHSANLGEFQSHFEVCGIMFIFFKRCHPFHIKWPNSVWRKCRGSVLWMVVCVFPSKAQLLEEEKCLPLTQEVILGLGDELSLPIGHGRNPSFGSAAEVCRNH